MIDVDDELERREGRTIERIFAEDGEGRFREIEERLILELLAAAGTRVLALGGGALGSARVREALADHLVVWVDVDVDTAWARCRDTARPLAADRDRFTQLHVEREPVYARRRRRDRPPGTLGAHGRGARRARGRPGAARPCCGR